MKTQIQEIIQRYLSNELLNRIIKNTGFLFSGTMISAALSMIQGILVARLLGVSEFGILGGITAFSSVINRLTSFRIGEFVVKYVGDFQETKEEGKSAAIYKLATILEVVGAVAAFGLIWLLAPIGAQFFAKDPGLADWFRVYALVVLVNSIYESSTGLLQVFDKFKTIASINAIQSLVTLAVIIYAYVNQYGLRSVVLGYMAGKLVGALATSYSSLKTAFSTWGNDWWKTPLTILSPVKKELRSFVVSTNISSTISLIAKDSEVLWVAGFLDTTAAGYYKLALALSNLLQLPVSPLPKVTFPELAREMVLNKWNNVRYILKQGSRIAGLYSIPVTLGLVVFGKWIISFIYDPKYLPAYEPLIILLIGFTFVNIFYWNRVAILSLGRAVYPTVVNTIGMIIKVIGIFLLVPKYGYYAFAGLLSFYYIFSVGFASMRVLSDVKKNLEV